MKKIFVYVSALALLLSSCSTTMSLENPVEFTEDQAPENLEQEETENTQELNEIEIIEELKTQDIEDTVIFVEKPVYIPEQKDNPETDRPQVTGTDATDASLKRAVQKPENYKDGTFFYQFNENFVYEIYAQPFHLTDIELQSGEVVIGTPLLSEDESVWELTAGVAKNPLTGEDIQHLFVKPAYSKLDSTLIIITDRRVYHFRLKSYSDTHMSMVRFTYPLEKNSWAKKSTNDGGRSVENRFIKSTNPELLSFDYKIKYSRFKKPEFLPQTVYDDGQYTYIRVDPVVLQKKLPVLFNERNEIVNYSVQKNLFVIPRLINRVTLRLGKEKVEIEKKITKVPEVVQ